MVEHFLGKEGVTGSIPVVGFVPEKILRVITCKTSFNCNVANANAGITVRQKTRKTRRINSNAKNIVRGAGIILFIKK